MGWTYYTVLSIFGIVFFFVLAWLHLPEERHEKMRECILRKLKREEEKEERDKDAA